MGYTDPNMWLLLAQIISLSPGFFVSGVSITDPGDVVAGYPLTLECKITRPVGNRTPLYWAHIVTQTRTRIYVSSECTPSIPLSATAPAGLSGGCQRVKGEEVYTVRIANVTEDIGQVTWRCRYGLDHMANVTLELTGALVSPVPSVSLTTLGDVVAGRPYTLKCSITRPTGDTSPVIWDHIVGNDVSYIYSSSECTPSISAAAAAPPGLSGGCQHVNGEEVYTLSIENVTEDTGLVRWKCQYGEAYADVTLDVKVMVTLVTLTNPPGKLTAGDPTTFTCVTSASKPQACIICYIRSSGNVRELDPADCNPDTSSVQTTTRTLTFTASAEENGAELYCDADNSVTDPPVRSQVHTLDIQPKNVAGPTPPGPPSGPPVLAVAAGVTSAVVLVLVIAVIVFVLRRKRRGRSENDTGQSVRQRPMEYDECGTDASRVYQTLDVPRATSDQPVYLPPVQGPFYENGSAISGRVAQSQDTGYARLEVPAIYNEGYEIPR